MIYIQENMCLSSEHGPCFLIKSTVSVLKDKESYSWARGNILIASVLSSYSYIEDFCIHLYGLNFYECIFIYHLYIFK